jgi:hypothetical protein
VTKLQQAYLLACGVAAFIAAVVLFSLSDLRGAIVGAIVAASSLILIGRATRSSSLHWLVIGLLAVAFLMLGLPLIVVLGTAIALFVLQLLANVIVARNVGRLTLERLADPAVMAGAEELVREFFAEGFRMIGSYRFHTGGKLVILTVMIGPERDRLAVVTDRVWQAVSRFGTRSLLTTNSALSPLPVNVLRQQVVDGGPPEIVRAHDAALMLLGRHSQRPDVFASDDDALEAVHQMEQRAIAFIRNSSVTNALRMETAVPSRVQVLRDDSHSLNRINAWLGAES